MHRISQRAFLRIYVVQEIKCLPLFCHFSKPALTEKITEDRPRPAPTSQISPTLLPDDGGAGGLLATVTAAATAAAVAASTPHLAPHSPLTADASAAARVGASGGETFHAPAFGGRHGSRPPRSGAHLRRPRPGAPGSRRRRRRKSQDVTQGVTAKGSGIDTAASASHNAVAVDGRCRDASSAPRMTAKASVCGSGVLVGF